jgi:Putative transposase/Transposase zinc-binding domain
MATITEIFRVHGPDYMQQHPDLPDAHLKVIDAILNCRTGEYGYSVYRCGTCGQFHTIGRSCGNRHCPQCQHHKSRQWLETQLHRQMPCPHFLITFTVPEELRDVISCHQRDCYEAMFRASSEALKLLAREERFMGTDLPGFTGVLHTWGRQLQFHPHIHYIVAGGGLSRDRSHWLPSRADFYVPVKALSPIYRAKYREEMRHAGLLDQIPSHIWEIDWNVNSQAVGNGSGSLMYLAPYVFRVALSNSRIVAMQDHTVTFKYRKEGSSRYRSTTLEVREFIRRFLQHVLPSGFMKVRHFGFMNATCSVHPDAIRQMISAHVGIVLLHAAERPQPSTGPYCPDCGGVLLFVKSILPLRSTMWDTS